MEIVVVIGGPIQFTTFERKKFCKFQEKKNPKKKKFWNLQTRFR